MRWKTDRHPKWKRNFAWFPVSTRGGYAAWLQFYWSLYDPIADACILYFGKEKPDD